MIMESENEKCDPAEILIGPVIEAPKVKRCKIPLKRFCPHFAENTGKVRSTDFMSRIHDD